MKLQDTYSSNFSDLEPAGALHVRRGVSSVAAKLVPEKWM